MSRPTSANRALQPPRNHRDRRQECRYPCVLRDGMLEWSNGAAPTVVACRIVDFSLNGCMVEPIQTISLVAGQSIRFRAVGTSAPNWIDGALVGNQKRLFRKGRVRIRFHGPFPYDTFKEVVYGTAPKASAAEGSRPAHERDHFWR